MIKITKNQALRLVPDLVDRLMAERLTGEVALTRNGCKIYRKKNGHFALSGYAYDMSDVKRDMASIE
jgi:hypothetical protein